MENPNSLGLYLIKCMAQIIQADSMLNGDAGTCLEILVPYKPQER
jgi:two-component sensor histidine kinase